MNFHLLTKYHFSLHGAAPVFITLAIFSLTIIAIYSRNYLHEEQGRERYWVLYSLFSSGIIVCGLAGNLETFLVGWEMVGLASFFLIGFYQSNVRSVENSLIALANYKMCDIFLVLAIFLEEGQQHTWAGASLIVATLAKSAQFPFSSWLYRALEGPTPSSTVFYGGLSLHLGAFLLLQHSGLWEGAIELRILMGFIGLSSTIYGLLVGATRSDLKTSFAFASISQVGLIYIELALGWYSFALWHIVGHNILRTWNYLRSASFFEDFFREEHHRRSDLLGSLLKKLSSRLYVQAFNGFYLDQLFLLMRNGSLILFWMSAAYFFGHHLWFGTFHVSHLLLIAGAVFAVYYFIKSTVRVRHQVIFLFVSQLLVLGAIHLFYVDRVEETYLVFTLVFLGGLVYSLWPAFKIWFSEDAQNGDHFLGLAETYSKRHWIFLFCSISIAGSPGTLQFLLQETLLEDLWGRSHTFMILSFVCLTLNSYHFFRLGQHAFLGDLSDAWFLKRRKSLQELR